MFRCNCSNHNKDIKGLQAHICSPAENTSGIKLRKSRKYAPTLNFDFANYLSSTLPASKIIDFVRYIVVELREKDDYVSTERNDKMNFSKLMDPNTFGDLMYPGTEINIKKSLPSNIRDLLHWNVVYQALMNRLTDLGEKAELMFNNIRRKASAMQQEMDENAAKFIITQIVEELIATELIRIVRTIAIKTTALYIKQSLKIARDDEESNDPNRFILDEISSNKIRDFTQSAIPVAIIDSFMGHDWIDLLRKDLRRFSSIENGMAFNNRDDPLHANSPFCGPWDRKNQDSRCYRGTREMREHKNTISSTTEGAQCRLFWLDKARLDDAYPAMAEMLMLLHRLPYEINGKPDNSV